MNDNLILKELLLNLVASCKAGERPSDLYGTDGTPSLTPCAASIDTSESWVCCREKHKPRILPLNAICSRIGRGVTGHPCTGGQNHAYERRDLAPYGYSYWSFCQISTPRYSISPFYRASSIHAQPSHTRDSPSDLWRTSIVL